MPLYIVYIYNEEDIYIYIYIYLLHYSITPPLNINGRSLINKDDWLPDPAVIPN